MISVIKWSLKDITCFKFNSVHQNCWRKCFSRPQFPPLLASLHQQSQVLWVYSRSQATAFIKGFDFCFIDFRSLIRLGLLLCGFIVYFSDFFSFASHIRFEQRKFLKNIQNHLTQEEYKLLLNIFNSPRNFFIDYVIINYQTTCYATTIKKILNL